MTRRRPAALLLDLDGTLVDSEPIHRAAYEAFFTARGWEVTDLTLFTGRRAEDVFASEPGPWDGEDPDALKAAIAALVPVDADPDPVRGARAVIEAAAERDVPVAIVTSAGPDWAERCLDVVLGVRHHVGVVVTAHDVVGGKPDPAGFRHAADLLGVPTADCIAVEDSPAGVTAALAAGVVEVYGLSTTHAAERLTAAGAVAVHSDLRTLAGVFTGS